MGATVSSKSFSTSSNSSRRATSRVSSPILWLVLFAALISGCESTAPKSVSSIAPASWPARQQQLEAFTHWLLQGKLAVIQPDRSDNLVINQWRQNNDSFTIHVSSMLLGLGSTEIIGTPAWLSLRKTGEPPLQSADPAELLKATLGWSLPLHSLNYWIKGLPKPAMPAAITFDEGGNPFSIEQDEWLVQLDRYRSVGDIILPGKITLTKGEVKLKLIVTNWSRLCDKC